MAASPSAVFNPYTRNLPPGFLVNSSWGPVGSTVVAEDNQLFDLGLQFGYKIDYLSAYVNFVKNFGSVDLGPSPTELRTKDYTGWMVDAGMNYFCGPWTVNVGGF